MIIVLFNTKENLPGVVLSMATIACFCQSLAANFDLVLSFRLTERANRLNLGRRLIRDGWARACRELGRKMPCSR